MIWSVREKSVDGTVGGHCHTCSVLAIYAPEGCWTCRYFVLETSGIFERRHLGLLRYSGKDAHFFVLYLCYCKRSFNWFYFSLNVTNLYSEFNFCEPLATKLTEWRAPGIVKLGAVCSMVFALPQKNCDLFFAAVPDPWATYELPKSLSVASSSIILI